MATKEEIFGKREDQRILNEDEILRIWEEFFGKRYSLTHIAQNLHARKQQVVSAIENEATRRCKLR